MLGNGAIVVPIPEMHRVPGEGGRGRVCMCVRGEEAGQRGS